MTVERQDSGATPAKDEDPFDGFQSEEYEEGELVASQGAEHAADDDEDAPGSPREAADASPEAEGDEEPADDGDERPRPKQTAQERINELTRLRREAERKAEALQARVQDLETRFKAPPEPPKPQESEQPPKEEAKGPPDPNQFDYGEIDPRYIAALVNYQTDQRLAAYERTLQTRREQERLEREQDEIRAKFQTNVVETGSKVHDDFVERVVVGAERGDWALSEELGKMLVESDVGADIAYHLATHPEESLKVFRYSPVEQARYFGRMEARFSATPTAASGEPGKSGAKPPKAPPPVLPARGSDGKFQPSADSDDFSAFENYAMKSRER